MTPPKPSSSDIHEIITIQADESLRVFPTLLKAQLDQYFKTSMASIEPFTHYNRTFKVDQIWTGECVCFVEFGTINRMDIGYYRLGTKSKFTILVVQPRTDSSFNDGNPAIIKFFSKGLKHGNYKNIVSKWAIWTPTGLRSDTSVERMITSPPAESSTSAPPVAKRKKMSDEEIQIFPTTLGERGIQDKALMTALATQKTIECTGDQATTKSEGEGSGNRGSLDFVRSSETVTVAQHCTTQSTNSTPLPGAQSTVFEFKSADENEPHIVKTFAHCNTVQKLFAYAQKAGISDPNNIMLRASLTNSEIFDIVKDDEDDFSTLLEACEMLAGDCEIRTIKIEPVAY